MKKDREFLELTFVWIDKRRKKSLQRLELKEARLVNQLFNEQEMECIELRVKDHNGTREQFEDFLFFK